MIFLLMPVRRNCECSKPLTTHPSFEGCLFKRLKNRRSYSLNMVNINKTSVSYSNHLDSMVKFVKNYLANCKTQKEVEEVRNGLLEFCYNYPQDFVDELHKKLCLKQNKSLKQNTDEKVLNKFVEGISERDSDCIFLLRDTFTALKKHQQKNKKGFGILLNRKYLFDKEEDYFLLVELFYSSLLNSKSKNEFLENYFFRFKKLVNQNKSLMQKSKEVYEYVNSHKSKDSLIWIDMGFHFTFCLFGLCSVRLHSKNNVKQDIFLFSVYPWLKEFFRPNYFTEKNEYVLNLEKKAIIEYSNSLTEKSEGCLIGFAIGDSLGFPVAGIEKNEVKNFLKAKITGFKQNKKHPYFSRLKKGQYTDNTNLLILSTKNIIENNGFAVESYEKSLVEFLEDDQKERWLGPTALKAIERLSKGLNYKNSGSKTTESCSSTYRVIPLGIFYRTDISNLKKNAEISGMITHNSNISKTGAILTALIISNLMNRDSPEIAVKSSIKSVELTTENKKLLKKIEEAITFSKTKPVNYARKYLGTGSPIYQTLPLAIYCFLKAQNNFEKSILMAANSYRDDTPKEKMRLKDLSWKEQLQEANGGNTDGTAGLTGAFLGAYLGIGKIPKRFLKVEDSPYLMKLGKEIIEKGNP